MKLKGEDNNVTNLKSFEIYNALSLHNIVYFYEPEVENDDQIN